MKQRPAFKATISDKDDGHFEPAIPLARKPVQERSRIRFDHLLDVTANLLMERDFSNVGLYDIAKIAKLPPASVYHFFPAKETAFLALAERYLERMQSVVDRPIEASSVNNWPDLIRTRFGRVAEFFNNDKVCMKIFLGGTVSAEIRRKDLDFVFKIAEFSYDWMNEYLVMPHINDSASRFSVVIGICDGIWMLSYGRHGYITEYYAQEACAAAVAYMRTFLPEVIALRPPRS